jgi:[acyl-carrier-protein] S-malonyltransferase
MSWAALFPGQGSQYVGMGRALAEAFPAARRVFEEADDALGFSLSRLMWEGDGAALRLTEIQQPAILTVSVAVWRALAPPTLPQAGLGLSLGEYSALVASGLLPFADAVRVCHVRGQAMQQAVPDGLGGMTAILGLHTEQVEAICREAQRVAWVEPANYNAPGQVVVSGFVAGLEDVERRAREAGARVVRLPVSAPFHSRLLQPAEERLEEALKAARWGTAAFPVIANVDGAWVRTEDDAYPRLIRQVSHPVRFEPAIRELIAAGVDRFVELGPGKSLQALVKKVARPIAVTSVDGPDSFAAALELVKGLRL